MSGTDQPEADCGRTDPHNPHTETGTMIGGAYYSHNCRGLAAEPVPPLHFGQQVVTASELGRRIVDAAARGVINVHPERIHVGLPERKPIGPEYAWDCPNCGERITSQRVVGWDSLDAAWAEAEAALPEGWRFLDLVRTLGDPTNNDRWPPNEAVTYGASATNAADVEGPGGWTDLSEETKAHGVVSGWGPTPASALRALAAKLRDLPSD